MPDTDPPDAKPPKSLPIGPDHYRTGPGARHALGATAARFGGRAYLVHGEVGFARIADDLRASLRASGVETVERKHVGPATAHAASVHAAAAREAGADVVVTVGGGRVMDVGKSAAGAAALPCITVPTSPATCAGATVAVVEYDAAGVYLASPLLAELWLVTIVDTEVLAAAPDRLLAAGIADALAKIVEVRYVTGRAGGSSATVLAALALCERLAGLIDESAASAMAAGPSADGTNDRGVLAEAVVLWPALIGGLAGEDAKIAAAHAVHNALTHLPGSKVAIHGELVAYGVLVQQVLEGVPAETLRATAEMLASLGCPGGLDALGCGDAREVAAAAVSERTVSAAEMRVAFPDVSAEELRRALSVADEVALAAAAVRADGPVATTGPVRRRE